MHKKAEEVDARLLAGEHIARRALADERFTEVERAKAARAARLEAQQEAQRMAERAMREAETTVEQARAALVANRREWHASCDSGRQLVAIGRVASLDAGTWNDVQALAQEAQELGDYNLLTAIVGKLPTLLQRAREPLGPLAGKTGEIETLRRDLQAQIDTLEPSSIQQARAALVDAERDLAALRAGLASVNFRWSRSGGPGPLRPSQQVRIEYHPKTGMATKFTGARWP